MTHGCSRISKKALHPKTYVPGGVFGPKRSFEDRLEKKLVKTRGRLLGSGAGAERDALLQRFQKFEKQARGVKSVAKKLSGGTFKLRHKYHK